MLSSKSRRSWFSKAAHRRRPACKTRWQLQLLEDRTVPTNYVVDALGDVDNGNYLAGDFTIREAVSLANSNPGPDTITFHPSPFATPQTISLAIGELLVLDDLSVIGPANCILTLSGGNLSRIFNINIPSTGIVSISELVMTNGSTTGNGGAIYFGDDNLTLNTCAVTISNAMSVGGNGGGIAGTIGSLTMTNTTVAGNSANSSGGGVFMTGAGGNLTITGSTISGNTCPNGYMGGGLYTRHMNAVTLTNSTISGNESGIRGGGIGLRDHSGPVVIQNCTITKNKLTVNGIGGGLNVTSSGTTTMTLQSTIIAANTGVANPDWRSDASLNVTGSNNLIGVHTSSNVNFLNSPNQTGTTGSPLDPMLEPLANNGGRTQTHCPMPLSPVIDMGNNLAALAFDQRGVSYPRVLGALADVGAVECQSACVVTNGFDSGPGSLRDCVEFANLNPGCDTIVFAGSLSIGILSEIPITDCVVISANCGDVVTIKAGSSRVFNINGAAYTPQFMPVTLSNFAIMNGVVSGAGNHGGGILSNTANLTLERMSITSCVSNNGNGGGVAVLNGGALSLYGTEIGNCSAPLGAGGGIHNRDTANVLVSEAPTMGSCPLKMSDIHHNKSLNGGGIYNRSTGSLTVEKGSKIHFNIATGSQAPNTTTSGGGIYSLGAATVKIDCSLVQNNTTAGYGGGVYSHTGTLTINQSYISGNSAAIHGGGVHARATTLTMSRSTLDSNTANSRGGGLIVNGKVPSTGQVVNSTFMRNVAKQRGGGIYIGNGSKLNVHNSTVALNQQTGTGSLAGGGGVWNNNPNDSVNTNVAFYSSIISLNTDAHTPAVESDYARTGTFQYCNIGTLGILGSNPNRLRQTSASINNKVGNPVLSIMSTGGACPMPYLCPDDVAVNQNLIFGEGLDYPLLTLMVDQAGNTRTAGSGVDIGACEMPNQFGESATPVVSSNAPIIVTTPSGTYQEIQVHILVDVPINPASIDIADVTVFGPNGFTSNMAQALGVTAGPNPNEYICTYRFTPPNGSWDHTDNGAYTLRVNANQVFTTDLTATPQTVFQDITAAMAFNQIVTNTNDSGPGSLRDAMAAANANAGILDAITFDPSVFATSKFIALTGTTLVITDPVSIVGPGAALLKVATAGGLGAVPHTRVFVIDGSPGMDVDISGMTLDGIVDGEDGGVIRNLGGALNLNAVKFSRTSANTMKVASGGAISHEVDSADMEPGEGMLIMTSCSISGFTATEDGGAVAIKEKGVQIFACDFGDNLGGKNGGSVAVKEKGVGIFDSVFANNTAIFAGGAIYVEPAMDLVVRNITLSSNTATTGGGAVYMSAGASAEISNSTLAFNVANTGGGLENNGVVTMVSTIVAKNTAGAGPDINGTVSADFSLIGSTTGATIMGVNNVLNANPLLGSLASNGGPTKSHALLPGSPAINTGSNPLALVTDQRGGGFVRVFGGNADIGAFEVQSTAKVASVVVNNGDQQRSRVTTVLVTFNQVIALPAPPESAFELKRQGDNLLVGLSANVVNGAVTVVTLTFVSNTDSGSLKDGRYTLSVFAAQANGGNFDGNGDGTPGDDHLVVGAPGTAPNLFRLFGDATGDGAVSGADFNLFRAAFGGTDNMFDFDNDGAVAGNDFTQFRSRFGGSI